jgi:hypothetical protein
MQLLVCTILRIFCEPLQMYNENVMCMRTNNLFGCMKIEILQEDGLGYGSNISP